LPITLDVGCNNSSLIDDPMYMGWRHPRITGEDYYNFVDEFIQAVKMRWPNVLLQFVDFAQSHANPVLARYRYGLCCFNDDIQGTASVTLGTLLAACLTKGERLCDQRIVFAGAGSAGCGIAQHIVAQMQTDGLSEPEARARIFMVNRSGLLQDNTPDIHSFQRPLCIPAALMNDWILDHSACADSVSLLDVVINARPTILIGVSGQAGVFTR